MVEGPKPHPITLDRFVQGGRAVVDMSEYNSPEDRKILPAAPIYRKGKLFFASAPSAPSAVLVDAAGVGRL